MLKNSRVSGSLDTSRLGAALARPGMDTRTWVSLAIVQNIHVDEDEGVFVDVKLMPSGREETARLGTEYAGNGFGLYMPLEVDDEVVVEAPNGDPDTGLIVARRLHSASDPPPGDVVDHPNDVLLFVKKDRTVRIVTDGSGDVVIDARGSGEVKLGDESATEFVAFHSALLALANVFSSWVTVPNDGGAALKTLLTTLAGTGWPRGATKVKAK